MEAILQRLKDARVIAILRGKNPERLYHRGIELAKMGCTAIEVTLDSNDALQVVEKLRRDLDEHVLIGVGTLTDATQVNACISAGAQFALSPIHPKDMVSRCHAEGMLAIPGVATSAQLDAAIADGAQIVKLFPSTQWKPDQLASVDIPWMPVGGVDEQSLWTWLDAGAWCVGMGSNLCGSDLDSMDASSANWIGGEEQRARGIFMELQRQRNAE